MPFPYVFTFYSYKGGVGRSLAVMNVAYTLAGWGRHVLIVDMDLEAPGISGFLQRSNELAEPESAHPKDILSLLGEAARTVRNGGVPDDMAHSLPPLSNYIRAVAEEKLAALRPNSGCWATWMSWARISPATISRVWPNWPCRIFRRTG